MPRSEYLNLRISEQLKARFAKAVEKRETDMSTVATQLILDYCEEIESKYKEESK